MDLLFLLIILIFSIVLHEVAHAWVARREGDDTAEKLGRITLNPLSHLDLMGSFIVPITMWYATNGMIFGWAKPVPVDPSRFRDRRGGDIRVSLAGITANLGLAVAFTLLASALVAFQGLLPGAEDAIGLGVRFMRFGVFINLILAVFNLIPIPPLDGSHVLFHLLPRPLALKYRAVGSLGGLVLIGLIFLVPRFFDIVLFPVQFLMGWADRFIGLWT